MKPMNPYIQHLPRPRSRRALRLVLFAMFISLASALLFFAAIAASFSYLR